MIILSTDYVDDMIRIIEDLIEKGHAYQQMMEYIPCGIRPRKIWVLTGQSIEAVRKGAGETEGTGDGKKDHKDFALWKAASTGEPTWDSRRRTGKRVGISNVQPGLDYFGQQFDIPAASCLRFPHHGGRDLGECHTGCSPLVHHWCTGFVNIDGENE